ncbi:MAG: DNA mismatch endonuclease Vsr [Bacteroidales bacterium]|jgi:DNA mismatch endonuclease (patch repair protein)
MMDVFTQEKRSEVMSRIRGKNTKPELIVRKFLFAKGFRYRIHQKGLPGQPDIVLKKYRTVILIHGCFWHGHENCKLFVIPKTRTLWWIDKISRNKLKDETKANELKNLGWKVLVVWECALKQKLAKETLSKLHKELLEVS